MTSKPKSFPKLRTDQVRKLMYQIDMHKGRASQEVIDRWEAELLDQFRLIVETQYIVIDRTEE